MPHVFDRFYKVEKAHTPSKQSGTGLGLSIVKRIIDQHGPSVTLDFAYGTAGVGAMQNDNGRMADDHVVFDMQGRRVTTPTKGVYIVNGRKLVVR